MVTKDPVHDRLRQFGSALSDAMNVRGFTQRGLAAAIGKTQGAISDWVRGEKEPESPMVVFEVEKILEMPPGHLSIHLGYLPPEAGKKGTQPSFESIILNDPLLDETQKRGLQALYREWTSRPGPGKRGRRRRD